MNTKYFPKPAKFSGQAELQTTFGSSNLMIEKNSSVLFSGVIELGSFVKFSGNCIIDDGNKIGNGCEFSDVKLNKNNTVRPYSLIENTVIGQRNILGPFCFIRDKTLIGDDCIVGAHLELARSKIANEVKISHQAFVGDAVIADEVVIGAGTIFCNWNGVSKQTSVIGRGTYIGSGTMIVSPVAIGDNVIIGAGSLVNKDIRDNQHFIQKR